VNQRQCKGSRFSGPGTGAADNVASGLYRRNSLDLDRSRLLKSNFADGAQNGFFKMEFRKLHGRNVSFGGGIGKMNRGWLIDSSTPNI
jgi:hypothetical protein